MNSSVLIGCAGWSLSAKHASEFPTQGTHLERYSSVFSMVEINSSFYRPHRPSTYARWRELVPDSFRFSIKMPRSITHQLRLQNCEAELNQFLYETSHLRDKLGCILVQLPPSLRYDPAIADRFFTALRSRIGAAVVCEPRHQSWFGSPASNLLASLNIARVIADPPPASVDDADQYPAVASSTMYVRLHGSPVIYHSSYPDSYLERLANTLKQHANAVGNAWCVFDNTASGAAIPNALTLLTVLDRE